MLSPCWAHSPMFLISDGIPEYALFVILMVLMRVFGLDCLLVNEVSSCSCASRETCVSPDCSLVLTRQRR